MKRFGFYIGVLAPLLLLMTVASPALAATFQRVNPGPPPIPFGIDFADAIHADVGDSVVLPDGNEVWDFGDATSINNQAVAFPHFELALHTPGTVTISVLPGHYGPGNWQQAPNWSNGDYFWPGGMAYENGDLYVWGNRIHGLGTAFTPVGEAVAEFSVSNDSITLEAITQSSSGTESWASAVPAAGGGFWLMGTHQVPSTDLTCKNSAKDCKIGDVARVPSGDETNQALWTITSDVIPSGDNTGTVISLVPVSGGFQAYSKQCDLCLSGALIEKLTATTPTGPWTLTSQTWAVTAPSGCRTYSLYAHPADSGSAQLYLTYAVNGSAQYWLNQTFIPFP